jgi:Zn-dependent metalloprotease
MKLDSTVHYGEEYNNAFWNGTQMVYGDGDGDIFQRFTKSIDVIGHELTHGVTQYEAALEYEGQAGALNESFSDIFGSLVKQHVFKQTADKADWLIGSGLFTKKINGLALRSMKEPGSAYDDPTIGIDPQPDHMKNYVKTSSDNGGVHINSGIPNRAFYLTALELGGYAWERAGKIWYIVLTEKLRERSNFQMAANSTFEVAGDIFEKNGEEQKAIKKAWNEVGIKITSRK